MIIPTSVKESSKVMGYFAYTKSGHVICDGDACIISGSEKQMQFYLDKMSSSNEKEIIKKTRFGEIINGLRQGGAYAFDQEAYERFLPLVQLNGMNGLPGSDFFSQPSPTDMHFLRIQWVK